MLDKAETTHSLFKLMDACTQCRQIFHACAGSLTNPTHTNALDRIPQKLEQFGFELRNEIRRLGQHEDFVIFRFESIQGYSGTLALDHMLDCYQEAFNSPLTSHTRAMLNRQFSDLQRACQELDSVSKAA